MRILKFILLGFTVFCFGQQSSTFKHFKALYPNASSVSINKETRITIKVDNENINVTQEYLEEDLYLDDAASRNSKRTLQFSSFFELEKVEASSFIFSDGKYKEIKVKEFTEKDNLDKSFYDDSKSLNFVFPSLQKGAKSVLRYTENVINPRFLSPFYFADFSPIASNKVTITADKEVTLKFKEFNTENLNISFKTEEKRNTRIYTWEINQINKYKYEANAPTYKKIFPHIIPIITSYKTKYNTINLANKVDDLYQWYYSLVKNINTEAPDDALVLLVKNITANTSNDFEKVKAIYYWAQKNIKYIAFEYALGGFVPRQANDVFKKKYGDCKDNSSILFKMLEIAGIQGNLTWIGTRSIPYSYTEVPTPIVDNHMILSYTNSADKTFFLDATGRFISIEYPTPFIQGKEALISKGANGFVIKKVPIIPAKQNAVVDTTYITLKGESLTGTSKAEISGYKKLDCFNHLEYATTKEQTKTLYKEQFQKGNNTFIVDKYTETNKFNYDENFIVDYTFKINSYAKILDDEIYINLNLNKVLAPYKMPDDRENDIEYDYKNHFSYTTTFYVPVGYSVDYIPENLSISNTLVSTNISYTKQNSSITYLHTVTLNFINLNIEQQKELNNTIKKINKAYKDVVVLKKNKP